MLYSVLVHFSRQAEDHNGRLERDEQRDSCGHNTETPVGHDEFGRGVLSSTGERLIDANTERDGQKHG